MVGCLNFFAPAALLVSGPVLPVISGWTITPVMGYAEIEFDFSMDMDTSAPRVETMEFRDAVGGTISPALVEWEGVKAIRVVIQNYTSFDLPLDFRYVPHVNPAFRIRSATEQELAATDWQALT